MLLKKLDYSQQAGWLSGHDDIKVSIRNFLTSYETVS